MLRTILSPSFVSLESQLAQDDIGRVRGAFAQDLESLVSVNKDYATWDEMHQYAQDHNPQFAAASLADSVFPILRVDLIMVFDGEKKPVFAKALETQSLSPRGLVEADPEVFKSKYPILSRSQDKGPFDTHKRAGTLRLSDGRLMEVVAAPILKSDGQGPVVGTVVMGRVITDKLIAEIRDRTKLPFLVDCSTLPKPEPTDDHPIVTDTDVKVSAIWIDLFNQPAAKLRLARAARIVEHGQQALAAASVSTLAVLSVALLVLFLLLHIWVMLPIGQLAQTVNAIHTTGDLATRVEVSRRDEIGFLALSFNRLLALLSSRAAALEHLATSDELTGLYNRRHLMDRLHSEVERAFRYDLGLAIMLLDIDHFKRINDTAGHAVGDRVLRIVAHVLRETLRETDIIGRYGGEEFLVVMPNQTAIGASLAAERLRAAIEACQGHGLSWPVTASIGVAVWSEHTREALLYIADQNMYAAKSQGRNRVMCVEVPKERLPVHSIGAIPRGTRKSSIPS